MEHTALNEESVSFPLHNTGRNPYVKSPAGTFAEPRISEVKLLRGELTVNQPHFVRERLKTLLNSTPGGLHLDKDYLGPLTLVSITSEGGRLKLTVAETGVKRRRTFRRTISTRQALRTLKQVDEKYLKSWLDTRTPRLNSRRLSFVIDRLAPKHRDEAQQAQWLKLLKVQSTKPGEATFTVRSDASLFKFSARVSQVVDALVELGD